MVAFVAAMVFGMAPAVADSARTVNSGGATIVLTPTNRAEGLEPSTLLAFVKTRLTRLGLDGAHASRRGNDIVVRLPNGTDPSVALDLVAPAEMRFRPVLANLPPASAGSSTLTARDAVSSCEAATINALPELPTTLLSDDDPANCVVLPLLNTQSRLLLGPAALDRQGRGKRGEELPVGRR